MRKPDDSCRPVVLPSGETIRVRGAEPLGPDGEASAVSARRPGHAAMEVAVRRSNTTLSTMYAAGVRRGDVVAVDGRIFLVGRIIGIQPTTVELWRPTWWRRPVAWVLRFRRRSWRRVRNAWFDVLDALEGVDD